MADDPNTDPDNKDGTPDPTPDPKPADGRTFTQEDVNRMMAKTRREESDKYGDYEALKKDSTELQTFKESQMTAEEKIKKELGDSQVENASLKNQMVSTLVTADIQTKAMARGIDPDVAIAMVDRGGIQYDLEAEKVTGTDDALAGLVEAKPFLAGQAIKAPNLNGGPNTPTPPPGAGLTQDEKDVAARFGIDEDKYAASKDRAPEWRVNKTS